jgi:uncharacterized protein YkwD
MLRSARVISCCLFALVALPTTAANARATVRTAASCVATNDLPSAATVETARTATLCLLNNERTKRGMHPLRANLKLQRAANGHSSDMARNNYFEHDSQNGKSFMDRIMGAGYTLAGRTYVVAENIAWGQMELATPRSIVTTWMHSPGHRANILNGRLREIGIGIAIGDPSSASMRGATYTTDFGTRA